MTTFLYWVVVSWTVNNLNSVKGGLNRLFFFTLAPSASNFIFKISSKTPHKTKIIVRSKRVGVFTISHLHFFGRRVLSPWNFHPELSHFSFAEKDSNFANLRMEPWGQGLGSVSWEAFVSPPAPHSIIHIQLEMNSVYNVDNTVFVATFSQTFQDFFTTFWPKSSYGKEYAESVQQCDQCSLMSYVIF